MLTGTDTVMLWVEGLPGEFSNFRLFRGNQFAENALIMSSSDTVVTDKLAAQAELRKALSWQSPGSYSLRISVKNDAEGKPSWSKACYSDTFQITGAVQNANPQISGFIPQLNGFVNKEDMVAMVKAEGEKIRQDYRIKELEKDLKEAKAASTGIGAVLGKITEHPAFAPFLGAIMNKYAPGMAGLKTQGFPEPNRDVYPDHGGGNTEGVEEVLTPQEEELNDRLWSAIAILSEGEPHGDATVILRIEKLARIRQTNPGQYSMLIGMLDSMNV